MVNLISIFSELYIFKHSASWKLVEVLVIFLELNPIYIYLQGGLLPSLLDFYTVFCLIFNTTFPKVCSNMQIVSPKKMPQKD